MPSLYAEYIKEKDGVSTIEQHEGFMTYKLVGNGIVYILDCYIRPEYRNLGLCEKFMKIVEYKAKKEGCTLNTTSVQLSIPNASQNIRTYIGYGYKIYNVVGDIVHLSKEIV